MKERFATPDTLNAGTRQRTVVFPADFVLWEAINAALYELCDIDSWEPVGAITPEECAAFFQDWYENYLASLEDIP